MTTRTQAETVIIDDEHAGRRLDNYLAWALKGVPMPRIYRLVRRGEVRVNGGRVVQSYRLRSGDRVRIPPLKGPATDVAVALEPSATQRKIVAESLTFENEQLLVINKPAGLSVHSGSGTPCGVIEILRALRPNAPYLELVHRLDRETSGCLLIAKAPSALRELHAQIRAGGMEKNYLALVRGQWHGGEQVLTGNLARLAGQSAKRKVVQSVDGKDAVTIAEPKERFEVASLLAIRILTGRTHQIRVHLADAGYPIVGDCTYGDANFNREIRSKGAKGMFLHAHSVGFNLAKSGKQWFEVPLPPVHNQLLSRLRDDDSAPTLQNPDGIESVLTN